MRALLIFAMLFATSGQTAAQTVLGSLSGMVRDEAGAGIPGANIEIRNVGTGRVRTAVSDMEGRYQATFLTLGEYQIQAARPGFRTESRTGVELNVGREAVVDFRLRISEQQETVVVTGDASLVETVNPSLSGLVDSRKISELPLNGRDIVQLIQLQTGVQAARTDPGNIVTGGQGTRIAVAGARTSMNVYMLDGTVINNLSNRVASGATGTMSGIETIKEFRAYTNNYSAEFSRAAGGAFNIVTKSGTNALHGSLFWFLRNDNFDARNFFDFDRPEFLRHQAGASLGGPVVKDRTFFFGSYEGFRERLGQTIIRLVPSLEARQGIVGNQRIPIAPQVQPYLDLWPQPTGEGTPGSGVAPFVSLFDRPVREDLFNTRLDHQFTDADALFVRYTTSDSWQNYLTNETFPQFPNRITNRSHYLTLQETHILSPRTMNELRLGFARTNPLERILADQAPPGLAFIPGEALGSITIAGLSVFGPDRSTPRRLTQNSFQFSEQLTLTRGAHTISLGMQLERLQYNVVSVNQSRGDFRFAGIAEFLRGQATTFEGVMPGAQDFTRGYRQTLAGSYLQDAWRVSPRLLLHLGLRHEFVTVPTEQHGRMNNLHHFMDPAVTVGPPFRTAKDRFAPRFGFAFNPRRDGKTAIRGGFGLFYVPFLASQWWNSIVRLPPFTVVARASGAEARFPDALAGLNPLGRESISAIEYDNTQPYMMQYNLSIQRELLNSTILTVAWVASSGVHLGREADFNIGAPGHPVRRNPNFSRIRFRTWDARSSYHSLQTSLMRRFRRGLQYQLSYTYGKSMDDASTEMGRLEYNNGQARSSDPFNRRNERARSSFDVTHNLVANAIWDMPWRSERLPALLNGWQLNSIVTLTGGNPFTPIITTDLDRDGTDDNEQRPNLRPGASPNPVLGRPEQWFDPTAFYSISAGERGNLGRNTIGGPGLATVDLGAVKTFRLARWDSLRFQFRAEAFNLFNRANFDTPPRAHLEVFSQPGMTAAPLPEAGRIISTSTPARQLQFALRAIF